MDYTGQAFEVPQGFVIENIDTVRELMIACKEFGCTHFELGDFVMEFPGPQSEDETESNGVTGFSSATTVVESNDGEDEEDLSHPAYKKLFKKGPPRFKRAEPGPAGG